MNDETNQSRVERAIRAMSQGDMNPLLDMLARDVRWTVMGDTPFSGTTTGAAAMLARLKKFMALLDGPWAVKISKLLSAEDHVFVALDSSASGPNGSSYSQQYCVWYRFQEGLIVEIEEYPDTQKLMQFLASQKFNPARDLIL